MSSRIRPEKALISRSARKQLADEVGMMTAPFHALLAALCLVAQSARAAPGDLDAAFGTGGKVTTDFSHGTDEGFGVALQSDGKLLVAGASYNGSNYVFALARYNSDGGLDSGFGADGRVTTALSSKDCIGRAVAVQRDGKILVAGYSTPPFLGPDFALVRYTTNGALDASFGAGGKVITSLSSLGNDARGVALQNDGKILVAGYYETLSAGENFALLRFTTNGALDNSFGAGGEVTANLSNNGDLAQSLAVQSDGKIVVAGYSYNDNDADFALVRYTTNGVLDASFGTAGAVITPFETNSHDTAQSVAIQSDGKLVVAGTCLKSNGFYFGLARYTTNGALDTSFGIGGKVSTGFGNFDDYGQSVAVQSNGKIVVAGYSYNGSNCDFALARYTTNGVLDASFGTDGKVTTDSGSFNNDGQGVVVQDDGRIVVAGYSFSGTNNDFALARYLGDPPEPPSLNIVFSAGGQATISWSPNTPGFVLQESTLLSPAGWTNSPSGATNPVTVPATLPGRFYRLFKP